jgi:uncharacterized protein (DUF2249 family)
VRTIELDVRPYHDRGEEPFNAIMAAVESLDENQQFLLVNSFEPKPLYAVLKKRGFSHKTMDMGNGEWRVLFTREP